MRILGHAHSAHPIFDDASAQTALIDAAVRAVPPGPLASPPDNPAME
jgi:hypothetical protein